MKKSETVSRTDQDRDTVRKALRSFFPSIASFSDFKDNDREISQNALPAIIHYAFLHNVITTESEAAFIDFLGNNVKTTHDQRLPDGLTFSDVLEMLTGTHSVNALIVQLDKTAQSLHLPAISATMITRLKQSFLINSPKKRALLRLLAFWLAWKHPESGWHYDLLLQLPTNATDQPRPAQEKSGVKISFHLRGHGEIITPSDVLWLKNELTGCIDYLRLAGHIHKKMIETIGATSFSIRSLKKSGSPDEPRLYMRAIRNVLAIAHQMSARWLLCPHSSPRKKLLMIIAAGTLTQDDPRGLSPTEIAQTADDPGIYLTDFAYLCAGVADVNVGFQRCMQDRSSDRNSPGGLWSVTYFWPNHYYDYIPCLLEEKMLPLSSTDPRYHEFQRAIHFPELNFPVPYGAISVIHRFPQSSLLLLEIAKVLRARRMIYEADAVLSNLLLSNSNNLPARFLRMLIHCNITDMEPDFTTSGLAFEHGIVEGEFMAQHCNPDSEIWCAIGVLYFGRALKMLRRVRDGRLTDGPVIKKEEILAQLKQADHSLLKGLSASTSGQTMNCLFWLQYTRSFIDLFSSGGEIPTRNQSITLLDSENVFGQTGMRLFKNMGWIRNDMPPDAIPTQENINHILEFTMLTFSRYENAMLGRSYIPYMHYLFALMLWDFTPQFSPLICRSVINLLERARTKAEILRKDNICVYQVLASYIPADQFINRLERLISLIKTYITDKDLGQGDNFVLSPAKVQKISRVKLMLFEADCF